MKTTNLGKEDVLVLGNDHQYILHVKNRLETAAIDIALWTLSFMVKRDLNDADADALITKTVGSGIVISGTYNADPAVNTQRATATIDDDDTVDLDEGLVYFEWKRMDAGFETPLSRGTLELVQGVHAS